jgi:hypothetical protein
MHSRSYNPNSHEFRLARQKLKREKAMFRSIIFTSTLASLLLGSAAVNAQVYVRAPLVRVQTYGPDGVYVKAPLVRIDSPPTYPGYYLVPAYVPVTPPPPPPEPVYVLPPKPEPVVVAPAPAVLHKGVVSHYEFARTFTPTAGRHEVMFIHPVTNAVVNVSFTLPPGNAQVRALPRTLLFDYGTSEVAIHFGALGKAKVYYR